MSAPSIPVLPFAEIEQGEPEEPFHPDADAEGVLLQRGEDEKYRTGPVQGQRGKEGVKRVFGRYV